MELANGYRELTDVDEQRQRFDHDNALLQDAGNSPRDADARLLQALQHGLPMCSGVALGVDRLLMLQLGLERLADVISFDWSRA